MKRFAVGLVGCGGVSAMHLEGYRRHAERVQVVAACDVDAGRARQAQERYGIGQVFDSLERMIGDADWDVAVVCTPTPVREPVVTTLAAAGKPIFVEKPLADSYEEAERVVTACEQAGVQLAVDQNFRYHYPFHIAKQLIAEGRLGPVLGIVHDEFMFRQDAGWRLQQPRHALAVMGIHWLDGFPWMLGS